MEEESVKKCGGEEEEEEEEEGGDASSSDLNFSSTGCRLRFSSSLAVISSLLMMYFSIIKSPLQDALMTNGLMLSTW